MSYLPIENCLDKSQGSIYKLTMMVARRAQEVAEGAKPFIENFKEVKPLNIAIKEIQQGYLSIEPNKQGKK